jgi:FKBP12-rapamycin complex-associated protein
LKESWYEKLQQWEDALEAYEKKQKEDPKSLDLAIGQMRCLQALGEWDRLAEVSEKLWFSLQDQGDTAGLHILAPLATAATWVLGVWDRMPLYLGYIEANSVDGAFYRAILNLHKSQYNEAQQYIDLTRRLVDTKLTALVGESYNRAYKVAVTLQQLSEMEEILEYKRSNNPEKQAMIRKIWKERLKGCQRNVEIWQRILAVRMLVVSPLDDIDSWLKFSGLCRRSGKLRMSKKVLTSYLGCDPNNIIASARTSHSHAKVAFAYLKYFWATGEKQSAFKQLKEFVLVIQHNPPLQARCFLKLGEWQLALHDNFEHDTTAIPQVLSSFKAATEFDSRWYKAWHSWALANFEVASLYEKSTTTSDYMSQQIGAFILSAVRGFFRSIALRPEQSLQDTLRLLTLWFKHGAQREVEAALREGFSTVSIDTWLQVIPQLIARIHTTVQPVRRLIHELMSTVGFEHPQACVYPLTVASKSQSQSRFTAAISILKSIRKHSDALVEQAMLVSQELIRVAILWHEIWHEGLEEASRLYFGEHNVDGMLATLSPLHQMLEKGPQTMREMSFQQAFGRELHEAYDWCKKFIRSGKEADLNQAWDLYYHVFRRINKQLQQLTTLELQYVSPNLLSAKNMDLAVPGTYRAGAPIIRIAQFSPTLHVIPSKQRPRNVTIHGSDGNDYVFLLKGHEDLRQDERVMQLFGLVNTLLLNDRETSKKHLSIQRYSVVPLSPNSGLIGWVSHCDTLHALIRDHREAKKVALNMEHRVMLQMAPEYDGLSLIQKVEVFEHALESTCGQDLNKVLWLKSPNSEIWLERRTNYTR